MSRECYVGRCYDLQQKFNFITEFLFYQTPAVISCYSKKKTTVFKALKEDLSF